MDMVHKRLIPADQVAAEEVSTPAAEALSSLVVTLERVERVVKDFFREEWVVELRLTMPLVDLVEVEVLIEMQQVGKEEEEGTLEEAVEIMRLIPVEAVEDPTMLVKINIMNVAIDHLAMVRLS